MLAWRICWSNTRVAGDLINTLRPRQYGCHFPSNIFTWIFVNENIWILIKISLKFVPKGLINYNVSFVQIMAWRRPSDKPLSEPAMVNLLTHICITRPQWVKDWDQFWRVCCHNAQGQVWTGSPDPEAIGWRLRSTVCAYPNASDYKTHQTILNCDYEMTLLVSVNDCSYFVLKKSHYLNQCWHFVNWTLGNKFKWNFNQNSNNIISLRKMSFVKWHPSQP